MNVETVLSLMLHLAPRATTGYLAPTATAIANVSSSTSDAIMLVTIEWMERRFYTHFPYPFGLTCRRCWIPGEMTLTDAARRSLRIHQYGEHHCGSRAGSFRWYYAGACLNNRRPRCRTVRGVAGRACALRRRWWNRSYSYARRSEVVYQRLTHAPMRHFDECIFGCWPPTTILPYRLPELDLTGG